MKRKPRRRSACRAACIPTRSSRSVIRWASSGRSSARRWPTSPTRIAGASPTFRPRAEASAAGDDAVERLAVAHDDAAAADLDDAGLAPHRELAAHDLARHAKGLGEV